MPGVCWALCRDKPRPEQAVSFHRDIRPIFYARCVGCHQPAKASGSYDLTSYAAATTEGDRQQAPVTPRDPAGSLLVEVISSSDGAAEMPPEGSPLTHEQVAKIRAWIELGRSTTHRSH